MEGWVKGPQRQETCLFITLSFLFLEPRHRLFLSRDAWQYPLNKLLWLKSLNIRLRAIWKGQDISG